MAETEFPLCLPDIHALLLDGVNTVESGVEQAGDQRREIAVRVLDDLAAAPVLLTIIIENATYQIRTRQGY